MPISFYLSIIAFSGLYKFLGVDIAFSAVLLLLLFYGFLLKLIRLLLRPLLISLIGLEAFCLYITFYRCGTGAALSRKDKQLVS